MKKLCIITSILLLILSLSLLITTGCQIESDNLSLQETVNSEEAGIVSYLSGLGFNTEDYQIDSEKIIVEGDIAFDLDCLKEDMSTVSRQYRYPYQVSEAAARDIKVYIHYNVPDYWKIAARNAMVEWSRISGSDLYFYEVPSGQEDIKVDVYYEDTNVIAYARYPFSSGDTGSYVMINTKYNSMSYGRKLHTMVHEFGHNIGLRHVNVEPDSNYIHIPGTPEYSVEITILWWTITIPTYETDSVMNVGSGASYSGLSAGDIKSVEVLFPYTNSGNKIIWKQVVSDQYGSGSYVWRSHTNCSTSTYYSINSLYAWKEGGNYCPSQCPVHEFNYWRITAIKGDVNPTIENVNSYSTRVRLNGNGRVVLEPQYIISMP